MLIYSHNLPEKLFGFAHSRDFLKYNTDLCSFVDDPNLKLDIDLAIDFNAAIRNDLDAAERFINTLILSSGYLDITTAEYYAFKASNYPVFDFHIDRINYTFDNLDDITGDSFANQLKKALKDCLNSPCNLFAATSDSVGARARELSTKNTTTLPAFSEISDKFFNVLGGVSDTIFRKVPEAVQDNIVEMAQLTQRAWSTSVDMMFSKDPEVKQKLIESALNSQPLNSDSVGYRYVPDVRTYFNAATTASNILAKIAQDLGGCYNRAQHAYRYQPYNKQQNLAYTADVGASVKVGDEVTSQNWFGQTANPSDIRGNRDLNCIPPGSSPYNADGTKPAPSPTDVKDDPTGIKAGEDGYGVTSLSRSYLQKVLGAISRVGSRIVSLDFNGSSNPNATGFEIVIPYNATPAERKVAVDYMNALDNFYKTNGIAMPRREILYKTHNADRPTSFFTEPFFSGDTAAANLIAREPQAYARILSTTLGTLPGVTFAAPHGEYSRTVGASINLNGKTYTETAYAREFVIPALKAERNSSP
jgi:hypothetical protein